MSLKLFYKLCYFNGKKFQYKKFLSILTKFYIYIYIEREREREKERERELTSQNNRYMIRLQYTKNIKQ